MMVLVETTDGLSELHVGQDAGLHRRLETGAYVFVALQRARWIAIDRDGRVTTGGQGASQVAAEVPGARCALPVKGEVLVGTAGGRLFRVSNQAVEPVNSFDHVDGRDAWYTPWGAPPDTRWLSAGSDGTLYANVHVGGVLRSVDGGFTWQPTMDIEVDVHQVLAHPCNAGVVFVASARGLGRSLNSGASWEFFDAGLHHPYCRSVAVVDDTILIGAAEGSETGRAAIYACEWRGPSGFRKVHRGLPDWFAGNIGTGCLVASKEGAVVATEEGRMFRSPGAGEHWEEQSAVPPGINCLAI